MIKPVPKVAAFPPNVIPADPVNNHKVKRLIKSRMQDQSSIQALPIVNCNN